MSEFKITIEAFAGRSIEECSAEAIRLANFLGITVMFEFNSVRCMACPGDDAERLTAAWSDELRSEKQHKIARGRL